MILFATISTRHHRGRTYTRATHRLSIDVIDQSQPCRLLLVAVGVFLERI